MIIWDADGVLIDSRALAWWAAGRILGLFGDEPAIGTQSDYRRLFGRNAQASLVGEDGAEALRSMHRVMMRHYRQRVTTHAAVLNIMPLLRHRSIILTSALADGIRDILGERSRDFAGIFGHESAPKEDLLRQYASGNESMYVTDTITDVERCRAAAVRVCAVTWGFDTRDALTEAKPDALVDSPAALIELFASMGVLRQGKE